MNHQTTPNSAASIRHSACRWCYEDIPLEEMCAAGKEMGLESIELLHPQDQPLLEKHGLQCAIYSFPTATLPDGSVVGPIENAFNRLENHDTLVEIYQHRLREVAAVGGDKLICFPGNRRGMDDEQGMENCIAGMKRLLPLAEKLGVTLVMELLNSKVDHPDYMCDHSAWGIELCHRIASPNFGLLYDIYHMQVMEGDVIATICKHHECFVHYHTGGVPGRHEIDATQELNYPAIMRAIVETGYSGYVGQEFIPTWPDKLAALREAVRICTV